MKKLYVMGLILLVVALVTIGCTSSATTTPAAATTAAVTTTAAGNTVPAKTTAAAPITQAATAAAVTTAAATLPPSPSSTAKPGGILVDIEAGGPGSPFGNPADVAGGAGMTAQICLDQLMHEDNAGNITPNLAISFDAVTDQKNASLTFHIRKGVKFHDGTDFNAQAMKWNLDMLSKGVNQSVTAAWKSWEVIDDYTIKINLNSWLNFVVRNFTGMGTLISSPTAYEKNGLDWIRWHAIGTGAFKQESYTTDVSFTASKFADYWEKGKPNLDGLKLLYVIDQMTRVALFKSGGGDIMAVQAKDAADLQKEGYTILNYPAAANVLVPDSANADSPWSNLKVRQAAEYALDREALSSTFGFGFNPPAYQCAPEASPAYIPKFTGRKYDPAKAKALLAEAGYPNGFKSKLIAQTIGSRDIPQAIQAYMKAVGIQLDLEFVEPARYSATVTGTWKNALLLDALRPFPNFNAVLAIDFGEPTTFYKSTKHPEGWPATLTATTTSLAQDAALMQKAEQALFDDCTVIPTTYYATTFAAQKYVRDTGRGLMGSSTQFQPYNAWLSK